MMLDQLLEHPFSLTSGPGLRLAHFNNYGGLASYI